MHLATQQSDNSGWVLWLMHSNDDKCIRTTVDFWTRKTGKPISEEDAREMNANVSGFFAILREWDERDRNNPATHDDNSKGLVLPDCEVQNGTQD